MSDQRVRQSVCCVCGKSVKPGAGIVLAYGAGGRLHAKTCVKNAQNVTAKGKDWHCIFAKSDTFESLMEEANEKNVPAAANWD